MNHKHRRFLSLKWKALYLSTFLFILLTAGFLFIGKTYIDRQFTLKRETAIQQYQNQLNVLVKQSARQLQYLAATVVSFDGVENALDAVSAKRLHKTFDKHWWKFEIDGAVDSAAFFDVEGKMLGSWGVTGAYGGVLSKIIETESSAWEINCQVTCQVLSGIPILIDGDFKTLVIFSTSFTDIMLNFKAITGSNIGVIAVDQNQQAQTEGRGDWFKQLVAITEIQRTRPLLKRYVDTRQVLPELGVGGRYSWQNFEYELVFLPVTGVDNISNHKLVVITNVTEDIEAAKSLSRNTVVGAILGLIFSELVLLSILWRPTTELQKVVDALPMLAKNDFEAARLSFENHEQEKIITDETDVLKDSALHLSYQLEALHSLLNNRAMQLENRGTELETEKNFVLGLLNTAHALILTQDSDGKILMINQHGQKLLGLSENEVLGRSFSSILHGRDDVKLIIHQLKELHSGEVESLNHESPMINQQGDARFMSWFHSRLPEKKDGGYDILTVAIDSSERRQAEDNLGWLASHDSLTGLMNRRRFESELEQLLSACHRYGHGGAVFFIDLDQFKDINDSSGHQIGDDMLKRVAEALTDSTSDPDIVSRLGGDEFAILVYDCDEMQAGELADQFCRSLMKIAVAGKTRIHRISCSIGVSLFPRHGITLTDVLSNADIAMYQAKEAGRNTWCIFNEDEFGKERIQKRVFWNERVKSILTDADFEIAFQPIVRIKDGKTTHYEALLRVRDEMGRLGSPQQFIAAAERGGLMPQMDEQVITHVLATLQKLHRKNIKPKVSINLSGLSFRNDNLVQHIKDSLNHFEVDPNCIIFEITETSAVSNIDVAVGLMTKIKAMGCHFALDDFGVGFSSLHYLKQMPVDYLKIDGSFIQSIHKRRDDRVLVKALVDIASEFGQFTVAEFVDSAEALEVLKELKIDYVQGNYVGMAQPIEAVIDIELT